MPLITRRSSTRSTPRTSVGKWGLIRNHCSSLSQNKFLRTIPGPPFKFESGSYCQRAELMSSDPRLLPADRFDQLQPCPYRSLSVVLVGLRVAEVDQHAVAHVLRDEAAEPLNCVGDA